MTHRHPARRRTATSDWPKACSFGCFFKPAATVNTYHAAWPCRAIGGPLNVFIRRCRGFCKLASLVFFDSANATRIRRCPRRRRQWGRNDPGLEFVDVPNSVSICVAGASEGGRWSVIARKGTKHNGFCCCAPPRAFAGWARWGPQCLPGSSRDYWISHSAPFLHGALGGKKNGILKMLKTSLLLRGEF